MKVLGFFIKKLYRICEKTKKKKTGHMKIGSESQGCFDFVGIRYGLFFIHSTRVVN